MFPQNEYVQHITVPDVHSIVNFHEEYDVESFAELLDEGMQVLLVEDYQTTGLVGNVDVPALANINDDANTFYWFLRSQGATREQGGRGGSWGPRKVCLSHLFKHPNVLLRDFTPRHKRPFARWSGLSQRQNRAGRGIWSHDVFCTGRAST